MNDSQRRKFGLTVPYRTGRSTVDSRVAKEDVVLGSDRQHTRDSTWMTLPPSNSYAGIRMETLSNIPSITQRHHPQEAHASIIAWLLYGWSLDDQRAGDPSLHRQGVLCRYETGHGRIASRTLTVSHTAPRGGLAEGLADEPVDTKGE